MRWSFGPDSTGAAAMATPGVLPHALEALDPSLPIGVLADDRPRLVAGRHHVNQPAGRFDPQRSCHSTSSVAGPSITGKP